MLKSLGLILLLVAFGQVHATETAPPPPTTHTWSQLLQNKYSFTDAQMQALTDSKLGESHMAMAAQLSKSSNRPIEEILKMQAESKTGWGKLAKQLGVDPKELGQAVSSLKQERNAERKQLKDFEKAERKEKKEKKDKHEKPEKNERAEKAEKKDKPEKKEHAPKKDK